MTPVLSTAEKIHLSPPGPIHKRIESEVERLIQSLPAPERMMPDERRGMIARYTAVLEGNFIYWMTAASLAARSEKSRAIIAENLFEEVRDCHPGMLRRFAIAANAFPGDSDALAISPNLAKVRLFVGRLSPVPVVVMMAFFECFIQRFMAYLGNLARLQGSSELEYTDVHGICDIGHTQELLYAVAAEMELAPPRPEDDPLEGIALLSALIHNIVQCAAAATGVA